MGPIHHLLRIRKPEDFEYVVPGLADEILVNANLVEHLPDSTAAAVEISRLPYSIDPVLTRFQLPAWTVNGEGAVKRNYARLAAIYGAGTGVRFGEVPLVDSGGSSADWRRIGANVVRYQADRLADIKVALPMFTDPLAPTRLFAPALVAFGPVEERINRLLLEGAAEAAGAPVRALVVVPATRLGDRVSLVRLLDTISSEAVAGYFIWTPEVSESRMLDELELLRGLVFTVRTLASRGFAVGHLHGGYLAAALTGAGIGAVAHSLGWVDRGEPAQQTGGGPSSCSTYVPGLRRTCRFELARALGSDLSAGQYTDWYCDCTLCVGFLDAGQSPLDLLLEAHEIPTGKGGRRMTPTSRALGFNAWHFLHARRAEIESFSTGPAADVIGKDMERAFRLGGSNEQQRLRRIASGLGD